MSLGQYPQNTVAAEISKYMGNAVQLANIWGTIIYNVKAAPYLAKGDGVTDDTVAIQAAINAANAQGGGVIMFPPGTYITKKLTIYNYIFIQGCGRNVSVIKLANGTNDNLIEGYQSSTLWGTGSSGGLTHYGIYNIELDGNSANNTTGACIAVYGQEPYIENVSIKNAPEYGMRTEWGDASDDFGMEGFFSNIKIDTCGKHGWWFKGPHDSTAVGVIIINAGQLADNTYDGIHTEGNASARFVGCHVWTKSTGLRMRYALNDNGYGSDYVGCHFEGASSANVYANANNGNYSGCRFYSAWNGVNVILKMPTTMIGCMLLDPGAGRPQCKGIVLGEIAGDNASLCNIDVTSLGQELGVVDFTHSAGTNTVRIRGFNNTGTAWIGNPTSTDVVDIHVSGSGGNILVQDVGSMFMYGDVTFNTGHMLQTVATGVAAAGTNQSTAQALNDRAYQLVTSVSAGQGVQLYAQSVGAIVAVHNNSANSLLVYPETGGQIGTAGTNTAVSVPAGKGGVFVRYTSSQWGVTIG